MSRRTAEVKDPAPLLQTAYSLFELLLKALQKQEHLVYFMLRVSGEGWIASPIERGLPEQEVAYYANFLKLLTRKINQDVKYLNVFLNQKEPHFPLLLQLLRFHDWPDPVLHTSSKLAIMELSNNPHPLLQQHVSNFPFVLFYPFFATHALHSLRRAVLSPSPEVFQELEAHLKYMEDFLCQKGRSEVDMYANTLLTLIGRQVYHQLSGTGEKNLTKAKNMCQILLEKVVPAVGTIKVRSGLMHLFGTHITARLRRCFEAKKVNLESKHWIVDECHEQVVSHCRKVFFENQTQANKSIFKTINSYIPLSKDNYLSNELKKLSQLIGFEVDLDEPIDHDSYLKGSFLEALSTMVDDEQQLNPVFHLVLKHQDEEMFYYQIRLLHQLIGGQLNQMILDIAAIAKEMTSCTSLCLVQAFLRFVEQTELRSEDETLNLLYDRVGERLVHFVMSRGWHQFSLRVGESIVKEYDTKFCQDVYRQIECDILLFTALRSLLGYPNSKASIINWDNWDIKSSITCQTAFKCQSKYGDLAVVLDGQYLKIRDSKEHLVIGSDLLLKDCQVYDEGDGLVIVNHPEGISLSVTVLNGLQTYLEKEVFLRKELAMRVELELKEMRFEFKH